MAEVPIPLIGPGYEVRSKEVAAQQTINLLPEINPEGKKIQSLHAFPGMKEWLDVKAYIQSNSGIVWNDFSDRGLVVVDGTPHWLTDQFIVAIGPEPSATVVGNFSSGEPVAPVAGTGRADMATDESDVVIATGSTSYLMTAGGAPAAITDTDVTAPRTVTYLNGQYIFDDTNGTEFKTTQVTSTLSVSDFANAADTAAAESYSDAILRIVSFNQMVYFLGGVSFEPWWNSGVGNPPFDRVNSGIRKIGVAGRWAVAVDEDAIFFLDSRRTPMIMRGFDPVPLTNPALGKEFGSYSTVEDVEAMVYRLDGARIFQLNFPTADRTWFWHEPSNAWYQLSSGINIGRHLMSSHVYAYNTHIAAHPSNGKLYELDFDTFTDAGNTVRRVRRTANIHGGLYGAPGRELIFDRVEFDIEAGVGIPTGQGSSPEVMIRYSDDAGRTWSAEDKYTLGAGGDYLRKVVLTQQGRAYNRVYELACSDPVRFSLIAAMGDIKVAT